jgi:pimeloyl-ACP methyl ester carboxylesterase
MPEYILNDIYPIGLEQYFTVCWWDQRGSGLSYSDSMDYKNLTVEQNINDIRSVTEYLINRYHKNKIFLLAHSWGTFIGIQAVEKYPQYFYAYIGVGQHSNQKESERISYRYILNAYQKQNNKSGLRDLGKYANIDSDENTLIRYSNSVFRDESMHKLGIGTMRNMSSVIKGIFIPSFFFHGYTVKEKINLWKGKAKINKYSNLRKEQIDTDLTKTIKEISIPVVFMSGKYDYTVNWELSKSFYETISCNNKKFIIFENSAHSPLFEERSIFLKEMISIRNMYK